MAHVHADARKYPAKDDCTTLHVGGLGDMFDMYLGVHPCYAYVDDPGDPDGSICYIADR